MFTFQVDTKSMGVLSMLQQEPGAAVGLLTCSAGVGCWLLLSCWSKEKEVVRVEIKSNHIHLSDTYIRKYEWE